MKYNSILKASNQPPSIRSISFHPKGISSVRYFDLTIDEIYSRGRRMAVTKHFKDAFGLIKLKSKINDADADARPFIIPPQPDIELEHLSSAEERQRRRPVINGPASDPSNILERQPNFIPHQITEIPSIMNDFDSHSLRMCKSVLRGITVVELSDIFSLMSLKEESICIPHNNLLPSLEDRVQWRKEQNLIHLS